MQKLLRRTAWLCLVLTQQALALTNSLTLINLTGGITNYTGTGIRIGQVEGTGVPDSNHVYLLGQIAFTTNLVGGTSGTLAAHATQVAGVLVSTDAVYRGVAPGARVYSAEDPSPYGPSSQTNTIQAAWYVTTNQNVRVINMSDRTVTNLPTLGTDYASLGVDALVRTTGVIFVKSAGNSGPGTNTISEPGGAFNIIAVGAVSNRGTTATSPGVAVADFSSRGYLGDTRSKPDIVAPGEYIAMPTFTNVPSAPYTNRVVNDGTSFAAPHVAGVAARLLDAGSNLFTGATRTDAQDARTIKAVLLNSATKLTGWSPGQTFTLAGSGGPDVRQPLDPNQGAGLLNAGRAYDQLAAGEYHPTTAGGGGGTGNTVPLLGWDKFTVNFGLTNVYRVGQVAAGEMRLTLDWYRNVATGAGLSYSVSSFNDLDLLLWRSDDPSFTTLTLVAASRSTVDNVEHLFLTNMPAGYYQFGVHFFSRPIGADGSEIYSLAWSLQSVPEPSLFGLCVLGVAVIAYCRRRASLTR